MTDLSDLSDLDSFLTKVARKEDLTSRQKRLQSALRPGSNRYRPANASASSGADRLSIGAELEEVTRQLELIQWRAIASVALFAVQHCDNCGSDHRLFLQHMQRQTSESGKVTRHARVKKPEIGLPREVVLQTTTTHVCADCCGEFGFELATAKIKFATHSEPFAVSKTAIQEEIEDHG